MPKSATPEPKRAKPIRGWVDRYALATPAQYDLLVQVTADVDPKRRDATRRFLAHLIDSTLSRMGRHHDGAEYDRGKVPVHHRFIEKHFRGADWRALMDGYVIDVQRYDAENGVPRRFGVDERLVDRFIDAGRVRVGEASPRGSALRRRVLLMTGQPSGRQVKSDKRTGSDNAFPPLVRAAIDAIGPSPFNAEATEAHLGRLEDACRDASGAERRRARFRLLNDERCYAALFDQRAARGAGPLWTYSPAYTVQRTGRLAQKGGGLQSCSRAMKAAAYEGVADLRNYDLKSSQPRILITLMEEAGLEAAWLRRYGAAPEAKEKAAGYVGVSVDAWKRCLCAVLMSARVPMPGQLDYSQGAIKRVLREDAGSEGLHGVYGRFQRLIRDLSAELGAWHDFLVDTYVEVNGKRNNADGAVYVRNEVGMPMAVAGMGAPTARHELKARLAAHLLQGREVAFTHRVAAASAEAGFRVVSHEHDGLVTIGEVPAETIEEAAEGARLPVDTVAFEEKAFD